MEKKPKTKDVVRTVKEHTKSKAKDKVSQVGIKAKDTIKAKTEEQVNPQRGKKQEQSPESYASEKVEETAKKVVDNTVAVGSAIHVRMMLIIGKKTVGTPLKRASISIIIKWNIETKSSH